jgi:hypothetical protein
MLWLYQTSLTLVIAHGTPDDTLVCGLTFKAILVDKVQGRSDGKRKRSAKKLTAVPYPK